MTLQCLLCDLKIRYLHEVASLSIKNGQTKRPTVSLCLLQMGTRTNHKVREPKSWIKHRVRGSLLYLGPQNLVSELKSYLPGGSYSNIMSGCLHQPFIDGLSLHWISHVPYYGGC